MKQRGVIKVGGDQARVQRSTAATGNSSADVDGRRRSPLRSGEELSVPMQVTAGGIAPAYGYFKFSPDRITVTPLQGRRDLITWRESIEPQLEVVGLKGFADGTVPIPPADDVELRGEFRAAHLLTFMVISRCCSPVVQLAFRSCRERLDDGHQAWHFILSPYQPTRQQEQGGKSGGGGSGGGWSTKDVGEKRSTWDKGRGAAQGEANAKDDVVDEGRRQLQRQGPRRRGVVVLDGRRGGADTLASTGGWRGILGGGGNCASQLDGGAARQRLLLPPDADKGSLRRHGAEQRCEAHVSVPEDVGAALTSIKRRNSKGKGGRGSRGGSGGGGGGSGRGSGGSGRGGGGGGGGGDGGGSGGGGRSGGGGTSGSRSGPQRGGPGGGRGHQQQHRSETQTPQQPREWLVQRGAGEGSQRPARAGKTCGRFHTERRCFARLDDAWRTDFGDDVERPHWADAEGDSYWCVPPDPAALGASASGTPPGTAPAEALHTFTLDFGASRCFFRDSTTLTPLPAPVPARLADPSGGPVVASSSTVLPCPAVLSGSLSRLHLPSFSTNLVSTGALQDAMVTTTTPGGHRVSICTCTRTGRHLATFTRRPGSSVYTLATEPPEVVASAQVSASGQVAASCSCRLLSHQTLLSHHRLGHPSLPRRRGMHSSLLVSGLPRSLPPLPPSPALPCLPCVEGRQCAAPHSSSFPPTTAPLQTLHMDVWGPARVSGQGHERYFLLVVDEYTRYTTVFPLRSKGDVSAVLIPWIRAVRLQLRARFGQDLPVLCLHSDRGGEFSSDLLRDFCRGEGITQSFTLPDSPQQNGIVERRIGLAMEVARTSMIHAAAPHFLWPFAVRYAAHQLNLWPRVSLPKTSPTLRWTGKVGDASVFQVWGSRAFVRDTSTDKLSARAIPCVFLGFVPDAPGWQFYHPTSRRVLPSQDVTFDESVPFYRLFPYRSAPSPPPPLFLAPGPPPVDPLPPQGPATSGVSQVDPLPSTAPVQVAVVSGAAPGAASGGGAEPEGVEPGGAESEGAEPEGAESEGAESGGAEPRGAASSGGPIGASPRLSSQQLREWLVQRAHRRSGAPRAGEPGGAGAGGAAITTGVGDPTKPGAAGVGGAGAGVAGVGGPGAGGAGVAGVGAVDPGAGGAGGTVRPRPYFVPLLEQVLGVPSSTGLPPPFQCPPPDQSQPPLQTASPLPIPSPYTEQSAGLTKHREPASCPVSPVRTARRAPRLRPPPVPGTHTMALRPSSIPLRVPLLAPPESSLPEVPDPESNRVRDASPIVARLLATAVTDPSFESAAASALVAELLELTASCRLDYASALVAESVPASPPSVGGECALGTDVLEDRQEDFECLTDAVPRFASLLLAPEGDPDAPDITTPRSYAEAVTGPYSSQWQAAMDAKMASWKSTSTYVDEVPLPGVNIVDGMWIFRVKRPPGSPPALKARYVARGFSQRQGVDYFQTFSPTPKMTTLWVLLHVAAQRDYELHSLDFNTAFLQGSLHEEIWLRRPPGFTGTTLAALGFVPSTADPSLLLRTDTSMPPFYVLVYILQHFGFQYSSLQLTPLSTSHSLSAPPSDESVEPSGPYPELVGCLITSGMGLVLGGRGPVVLTGHADASWVDDSATQRSSLGYTFSLGSGSVSWRSTRSSSVLSSSCEAEIYAGAMAAQELRWLTYLLTHLGEQPRSPPVLYVDNKAMIALCQEHRLEHRTKHIALRYFLARVLQQRGQLRLAYVATRANTADVFTKALPPGDHQRFVYCVRPWYDHCIVCSLYITLHLALIFLTSLLSAGQLKESGVQLKGDGDEMLLVAVIGEVLGQARYTGRVLCTDLRPCSTRSQLTEVVALRTIAPATKSSPDRLHARLAHVGVDTIKGSVKHEVATGLDIIPSTGEDPPCVSCNGGNLAQHTFPTKGSDAEEALAVVHIDLCGPFWVAAKDGSLYFLLLKDHYTRLNGMAEREMRTAVESVWTMLLLHMGVQHHWWHLALCQAIWVRNSLERSTTSPGTTPYQLLTGKKPDLTLARVWGCMVQFMVPEQQRGGKMAPKARWGLHLDVSPESKGWEVLDLTDNKVVTLVEVIFYETLSLEVWKAKYGPESERTQAHPPMDTSTATVPLLVDVNEPADEDIAEVLPPPPVLAPPTPDADRPALTPVSATGDEGSLEASPVAPASGIAGGRHGAELVEQGWKPSTTREQQTGEPVK
ncbi:unnamed protein product [Closterium sp. NIES-53]